MSLPIGTLLFAPGVAPRLREQRPAASGGNNVELGSVTSLGMPSLRISAHAPAFQYQEPQ